jgi:hypothetical protein
MILDRMGGGTWAGPLQVRHALDAKDKATLIEVDDALEVAEQTKV